MKIGPSIPLRVLKVSTPDTKNAPGGLGKGGADLKVGQLLKATVIGISDDGLLELSTDGRTITARSSVRFSPGSEIWLEVHKGGDPPLLSVATRKMAVIDLLRNFLTNTTRMSETLADVGRVSAGDLTGEGLKVASSSGLLDLLSGAALDSKTDPGKILTMIRALSTGTTGPGASGLKDVFENGGNALYGKETGGDDLDGLVKLGRFLEVIRSVNLHTSVKEPIDFSLFPCFFSSSSGWGHWMFSAEKNESLTGKGGSYSLDFFLNMSRLGEIHISLQAAPGYIRGGFQVENEGVNEFLKSQLAELKNILLVHGYNDISLSCRKADRELRQMLKETIEQKGGFEKVSLVDVKV